jgi:hypothetical protein
LKLHSALKKKELNPKDTERFVDAIELYVGKLPELQGQYKKSKLKSNAFKINSSTRNTESKVRKRFAAN